MMIGWVSRERGTEPQQNPWFLTNLVRGSLDVRYIRKFIYAIENRIYLSNTYSQ